VMLAHGELEVAFNGEYRELVPDERIVSTEIYEAVPDAEALSTLSLTESEGVTSMELLVEHRTQQARDFHVASGMEDGLQDALEDLDLLAGTLA
jgi:uncharacterized protein YndB with AHSA1/START domain